MEISVKETEYCKLDVHYEAGEELIDEKKVEVLSLFKKAPVKGFRKGRAPIDAIKMHYKNQINDALKRALTEQAYHNTLFEKSIKAYGTPDFKSALLEKDKFTCEFSLRKKPDFTLGQYKDLEIPKPAEEKSSANLYEEIMQDVRVRFAEAVPFAEDDFIQLNDNVIINYKVFNGEEHLTEFDSEGETANIGKSRIPGFDDSVLGMKAGDTREFSLLIPTEGVIPDLAGKTLKFIVTLVLGSKIIPMPLNDELAKKVGKDSFEELQTYIMGLATSKVAEIEKAKLLNQISAKLLEMNDITVPDWLKVSEAQYLAAQANVEWDKVADNAKEKYIESADRNVKLSLILDRIREDEPTAQLSDQEVIEMIKQTLSKGSENIDESLKQMNQNGYLAVLVARVRDENTLDFILKNTKILE